MTEEEISKNRRLIVAPKGIYKTPHGYRVQLNMESTGGMKNASDAQASSQVNSVPNTTTTTNNTVHKSKFSRNTKCFEEAVWLYEIAILISDSPDCAQKLLLTGNFESMLSMGVS